MSFTANASGGSYSHSHIYGIKVNEYYGSNANIRVRKSDGSWQDGAKDGAEYAIFNNSNQAGNKKLNTMTYFFCVCSYHGFVYVQQFSLYIYIRPFKSAQLTYAYSCMYT